jgi:hypothetical protein
MAAATSGRACDGESRRASMIRVRRRRREAVMTELNEVVPPLRSTADSRDRNAARAVRSTKTGNGLPAT